MRLRNAVAIAVLALASLPSGADLRRADAAYGGLLDTYVNPMGVRYGSWRQSGDDLKRISEVVMIYRSTATKTLEANERKALLINLYNTKVLETVLHMNPSGSIRALSKWPSANEIFRRNAMALDGKPTSLDDLQERLRDEFKDPRIHFALNCAARSCPPLRAEPYAGARLDAQLDDAVRSYLALPGAVQIDRGGGRTILRTTILFDWYEDDFKAAGGTLGFLKTFGPPEVVEAASEKNVRVEYQPYDWSLNVAP